MMKVLKNSYNYLSFNSSEILKQSIKILLYSGITLFIFIVLNLFSVRSLTH